MRAYIEKKPELLLSYKNYLIRNGIEIPVE
jgi:hypothetical protein